MSDEKVQNIENILIAFAFLVIFITSTANRIQINNSNERIKSLEEKLEHNQC
jgi:hypothetical protein